MLAFLSCHCVFLCFFVLFSMTESKKIDNTDETVLINVMKNISRVNDALQGLIHDYKNAKTKDKAKDNSDIKSTTAQETNIKEDSLEKLDAIIEETKAKWNDKKEEKTIVQTNITIKEESTNKISTIAYRRLNPVITSTTTKEGNEILILMTSRESKSKQKGDSEKVTKEKRKALLDDIGYDSQLIEDISDSNPNERITPIVKKSAKRTRTTNEPIQPETVSQSVSPVAITKPQIKKEKKPSKTNKDIFTKVLREGYGSDACLKYVVRKCYKACKGVLTAVCRNYKCKSDFKNTYKRTYEEKCSSVFGNLNYRATSNEDTPDTQLADVCKVSDQVLRSLSFANESIHFERTMRSKDKHARKIVKRRKWSIVPTRILEKKSEKLIRSKRSNRRYEPVNSEQNMDEVSKETNEDNNRADHEKSEDNANGDDGSGIKLKIKIDENLFKSTSELVKKVRDNLRSKGSKDNLDKSSNSGDNVEEILVDSTSGNKHQAKSNLKHTNKRKHSSNTDALKSKADVNSNDNNINILRSKYEKACVKSSRKKCNTACTCAYYKACEENNCDSSKKKSFKRSCKQHCEVAYVVNDKSDSSSDSSNDNSSDDTDSSDKSSDSSSD